jgi:hypothetical protein
MQVARTTKPTHICTSCWRTTSGGTYCNCRGDDNEAGEIVSFEDLAEALRVGQQFETDYWDAERRVKALQKQVDEMAASLAITVRWGTGDRQGWLETESGYDPSAPPWKEDQHA